MATRGAAARELRERPSPLVTPRARGRSAITGHFRAPNFATLLRWPGFTTLTPLHGAILQYICAMLDGRRAVTMPARQVAAELHCSVRSVRTAYQRFRLAGLVLTTETANARGGSSHLCLAPGPVLARLADYRAPSPALLRRAQGTRQQYQEARDRLFGRESVSRVFRGERNSPPSPVSSYVEDVSFPSVTSERKENFDVRRATVDNSRAGCRSADARPDGARAVECSAPDPPAPRQRRLPCTAPGPLAGPQARLVAALNAALGAAGPPTPGDQRTCLVVARIAVTEGLEREALRIAAYAGRVRWCRCRGALLRQRFVDALERAGLGDSAVPPGWQQLRRPEVVRVDRSIEPTTDF
jgi:hypothetical protein